MSKTVGLLIFCLAFWSIAGFAEDWDREETEKTIDQGRESKAPSSFTVKYLVLKKKLLKRFNQMASDFL